MKNQVLMNQHKKGGLALKGLENLTKYQSIPDIATANEMISSRTEKKKTLKNFNPSKSKYAKEGASREMNKSSGKLKKSTNADGNKGTGIRL